MSLTISRVLNRCAAGLALAVLALLVPNGAAGFEHRRIGTVKNVDGQWCRKGAHVTAPTEVYADDEIRYCTSPVNEAHSLVLTLERAPSCGAKAERTYSCTSPGLCETHAKLWLEGASACAGPGSGTLLISRPKILGVSSGLKIIPDTVTTAVNGVVRLNAATLSALSGEPIAVCRIADGRAVNCRRFNTTGSGPTIEAGPGLYGIYSGDSDPQFQPPNGMLLVAAPGSDAVSRWGSVPDPFRTDTSPVAVNERRLFLLDLARGVVR